MPRTDKDLLIIKQMRDNLKAETIEKDKEKIYYLYFEKLFSIQEMEQHFSGKFTYNELRDIIRQKYKEYYEKEKINGRK